ncbi:MAG: hypothetical protein GEV28_04555 [Actinophytocola sp.]|uniref:hypothetical protein n=1 Tax=Actinophytocola sp. TaxID=1872138 RepID=UPI001322515E|nr:hypothetical protein [Actinophytocola sp.]MPZ79692.1 hypothetical protein [Actinophytocola sp.]
MAAFAKATPGGGQTQRDRDRGDELTTLMGATATAVSPMAGIVHGRRRAMCMSARGPELLWPAGGRATVGPGRRRFRTLARMVNRASDVIAHTGLVTRLPNACARWAHRYSSSARHWVRRTVIIMTSGPRRCSAGCSNGWQTAAVIPSSRHDLIASRRSLLTGMRWAAS